MANEENLKPVRSKSEARSRGKKGGIASGIARREKKTMREMASILLSMPLDEKTVDELEKIPGFNGIKGKNITVQDAILVAQAQKALKGDKGAAEFLRDTAGEKPSDKLEVNNRIDIDEKVKAIEEFMNGM